MSYVIRSKHDNRSLLALPAAPGGAVRWIDPMEGIAPWVLSTAQAAIKARNMLADYAEVVPMEQVTMGGATLHTDNMKLWRECPRSFGSSGL